MNEFQNQQREVRRLQDQIKDQQEKAHADNEKAKIATTNAEHASRVCAKIESLSDSQKPQEIEKFHQSWDSKQQFERESARSKSDARDHELKATQFEKELHQLNSTIVESYSVGDAKREKELRTEVNQQERERTAAELQQNESIRDRQRTAAALQSTGEIIHITGELSRQKESRDTPQKSLTPEIRLPTERTNEVLPNPVVDAFNSSSYLIATAVLIRSLKKLNDS